jgi:hypothetical protein
MTKAIAWHLRDWADLELGACLQINHAPKLVLLRGCIICYVEAGRGAKFHSEANEGPLSHAHALHAGA